MEVLCLDRTGGRRAGGRDFAGWVVGGELGGSNHRPGCEAGLGTEVRDVLGRDQQHVSGNNRVWSSDSDDLRPAAQHGRTSHTGDDVAERALRVFRA